jgi:Flp pilus assembly CpaF family ATPase
MSPSEAGSSAAVSVPLLPDFAQASHADPFAVIVDDASSRITSALECEVRATGAVVPAVRRAELVERELGFAIDAFDASRLNRALPVAGDELRTKAASAVRAAVLGFGPLQVLLDDPDIETINANGCDQTFALRRGGRKTREAPLTASDDELVDLIRSLVNSGVHERRFDRGTGHVNAQLPDGSRLFAAMDLCPRPCLSIRKNLLDETTLNELVAVGLFDARLAALLSGLVKAKFNVLISGGTAAGKTTLLRALAAELEPWERLVTIEDTFELNLHRLPRHADVVPFQAREVNTEGAGQVSQAELLRWSLRMSPDRVIVGEVRGDELIPMCNAMNQGLDGSMGTVHASSSAQVTQRLVNIGMQSAERLSPQATVALVASAVNVIIQLGRDREGKRVVSSLREVCGHEDAMLITNELYAPDNEGRARHCTPLRPQSIERLAAAGVDPADWQEAVASWI